MARELTTSIALLCCMTPLVCGQYQQIVPGDNFPVPGQNETFDYVIIGGGTAGLAIAHRLAEDGTNSVAVIEAGGFYEVENGNTSVVPAYNQDYNYITPDSQWDAPLVDWGFLTTPQAGAQGQTFHYARGKMLAGCSAQNAMNYNRPTKGSLQIWAEAVNDTSYLWDNFLPYYEMSVNYSEPNSEVRFPNASVPAIESASVDSAGGPLRIGFPNWATPFSTWAQMAFRELGIADIQNLISGELIGSQYDPLTIDSTSQTRSSSQTSFLDDAITKGKTNLQIYTHTLAKQILFDNNKTAYGVRVKTGPAPEYLLSAVKEVVLSAGAFQSPQLLMVSGIGPRDQLEKFNIPIISELAGVGQNMWDHVVLSLGWQVNVETYDGLMNSTIRDAAVAEYRKNRTGILTNDMSDYLGWEKLPNDLRSSLSVSAQDDLAEFSSDWPEVEYEVSSAPFGIPSLSTPEVPINIGYLQPVLLTPLSRGNITLASADMADAPTINPNWLTNPTDQQVAVATLKRGRQFFETSAIGPVLVGQELVPGQDLPVNSTDAEILSYLQQNIGFNWHASCTCKMGSLDDEMAVLDSEARVRGVQRLRVVDASAFPLLPPGHPQATVYALAEKIAAIMLGNAG